MAHLEAHGLSKYYGEKAALRDFTHAFSEGKITVLLGPSGSGKTTALNLLAGILTADSGALLLDGKNITAAPPEQRDFGFVFQNYVLFPHLTVEENVGFGLRVRGVAAKARRERARETLELARIAHLAGRYVSQISGGEQQRVAVARAVAYRPRVLLMDEPLSAVDARLRAELRNELSILLRSLAITTIYVTHDQEEAMSLGDEIIVLDKGAVEQSGPARDVYCNPANSTVATLLGHANVFPIRRPGNQDAGVAELPFARLSASGANGEPNCHVMFRPEDVEIVPEEHADFSAVVVLVEFLGNRLRLHLSVDEHRILVDTSNDLRVVTGARLHCRVKPEKIRVLPS